MELPEPAGVLMMSLMVGIGIGLSLMVEGAASAGGEAGPVGAAEIIINIIIINRGLS